MSTANTPGSDEMYSPEPTEIPDQSARLPFRAEVFENSTPKQRFILLAARDAVLRDETSINEVARIADTTHHYVVESLSKFIHRQDLPAACMIANRCTPKKTYNNLTEKQLNIVDHTIVNPNKPVNDIAESLSVSDRHARYTMRVYADLIVEKNRADDMAEPLTEATDIPLDMLRESRDDIPVVPSDIPSAVYSAFDKETLMNHTPDRRFVLLATREWALRDDLSVSNVASTVDKSPSHVSNLIRTTFGPFIDSPDAPQTIGTLADTLFPDHSYESLSPMQFNIVNAILLNDDMNQAEIAERLDVKPSYVSRTKRFCQSIITEKRTAV